MDSPVAAPVGGAAVPIPALGPIAQFYNPPSFDPTAAVGVVGLVWACMLAPETLPNFRVGDLARTMHAESPAIELGEVEVPFLHGVR